MVILPGKTYSYMVLSIKLKILTISEAESFLKSFPKRLKRFAITHAFSR